MKRYFIVFLVAIIGINETITAQEADVKIGNLINQTDWFALEEEYPKLKDEMQSEMLKHLSEAMIGFNFNQPQNAIQAIDWLLANAQDEIGFGNVSSLILIKSLILATQGLYAESADNLSNFLTQVSQFTDLGDFTAHNETMVFYEGIRNESKPEIIRPERDVEIPLMIEDVTRGQLMYVPVNIKGKEYKFIYDTGASSTLISERLANEIGVRITKDSINLGGVTAKKGVIDSMMIGDIIFKNSHAIIGLPNEETDTIFQIDAVLGLDFIIRIGETQIFVEEQKIIFPIQGTELPSFGRNLMFWNSASPYLRMYSNEEKLLFLFDTGNVKTDLFIVYYEKHKENLDKTATKRTVRKGGFSGLGFLEAYQLAKLPLTIGNRSFELTNVDVELNDVIPKYNEDGLLGMDFITSFKRVIINFDDMFVKVE